jgi:chromosomal replication initiator protein
MITSINRIMIDDVMRAVTKKYRIPKSELISDRRTVRLVSARFAGMYMARTLTSRPVAEIGRRFKRDHTSVLYALARMEASLATDPALRGEMVALSEAVKAAFEARISAAGAADMGLCNFKRTIQSAGRL